MPIQKMGPLVKFVSKLDKLGQAQKGSKEIVVLLMQGVGLVTGILDHFDHKFMSS